LPLCKNFLVEEAESVQLTGKYLLVVDDNEDIRVFIKTHFKSSFHVLEASDGKEGCEIALKQVPDIIIADMLMPVMDGYAMCKKLKKDERTSHIPIIMLTAVTSKEKELDNLLTGIDDYITKPFDVDILAVKIDNLLQIRNTLREKIKHDWLLQPEDVVLDSPDDKFLKRAMSVVGRFMDDPELDIGKFSEEMGVSRMQLYRKFEALTNMTVKEFIRSVRLKRAAQMLRQEKLTISEVAWGVGFKDLSYFRKCFKEKFGMTPTEYTEGMKTEK
jgi:DNA-binding response OmpR family regulator